MTRLLEAPRRIGFGLTVLAVCVGVAFPVYWMAMLSVQPLGFSRTIDPHLLPTDFTTSNFRDALTDRPLGTWLANSVVIAIGSAILAVAVASTAAYALARFRFRLGAILGILVLGTQMLPPTTLIVPMYLLFLRAGILDTRLALLLSHTALTLPLVIWILRGFFRQVPEDLEHAAQVDGCSRFRAFRKITLPLATPGLIATGMYAFVDSWNDYLYSRTLASPTELWTAPVGLTSFQGEFQTAYEPMMAAATLFCLPVLLIFYLLQRHLVSGWTEGSVKE